MDDIFSNIINKLTQNCFLAIIGHSLGGVNSIHLARILSERGHKPDFLITLDPVGTGEGIRLISKIPFITYSKRGVGQWINVKAFQKSVVDWDQSDYIAWAGGQYSPAVWNNVKKDKNSPDINVSMLCHHLDPEKMFGKPIVGGRSAFNMLTEKMKIYFEG